MSLKNLFHKEAREKAAAAACGAGDKQPQEQPAAPAEAEVPSTTAEEIAVEVLREQAPSEQDSAEEVDRP